MEMQELKMLLNNCHKSLDVGVKIRLLMQMRIWETIMLICFQNYLIWKVLWVKKPVKLDF